MASCLYFLWLATKMTVGPPVRTHVTILLAQQYIITNQLSLCSLLIRPCKPRVFPDPLLGTPGGWSAPPSCNAGGVADEGPYNIQSANYEVPYLPLGGSCGGFLVS